MKILLINSVCGIGSTGKICAGIAQDYEKEGHEVKIAYGRDATVPEQYRKYAVRIGNDLDVKINALRTRLFDDHGFGTKTATKKFLEWAEAYDPDVLWLHNLHGYYIHVGLLFEWIKSRPNMQVKWTLHDCWAFTGHCAHFSYVQCDKWKTQCEGCPQKDRYPASAGLDRSRLNYEEKKASFTGVANLTIFTPSQWLANLVKQSFLGDYPVEVQYNCIDPEVFKPTPSDFRQKYQLEDKKILLGVASVWDDRKGLNVFTKLRSQLDDRFAIVLVGLSDGQIKALPQGVLGISRTHDAVELAGIYTAADVFLNPSVEETFGMTTVEAIYCGTPAIVYKGTACEEIVNKYGGIAVHNDINDILREVKNLLH